MITTHDAIRQHMEKSLFPEPPVPMPPIEELRETEWSQRFEELMRNRLVVGAFRYGRLHAAGKPKWDRIGSIQKRLMVYQNTGNTECLVDIANMCLLEFEEGDHPLKHFAAADDCLHVDHKREWAKLEDVLSRHIK
jgi:hypothetical protein